jgi:hypothetical protein
MGANPVKVGTEESGTKGLQNEQLASAADPKSLDTGSKLPVCDETRQTTPVAQTEAGCDRKEDAPAEMASAPAVPAAAEDSRAARLSKRGSGSRVSFHEGQPEAIVTSAALEKRLSAMEPVYTVGDKVEVKDKRDMNWKVGIVTKVAPLEVRPDGKMTSFTWDLVRHYIEPSNEEEESEMESSSPPANTAASTDRREKEQPCC